MQTAETQLSIATQGGSGTPVPAIPIEVGDVDAVYRRATGPGHAIQFELTDDAWGVRRFCVCDPTGKLLTVLSHSDR